jgi:hypothetical protein
MQAGVPRRQQLEQACLELRAKRVLKEQSALALVQAQQASEAAAAVTFSDGQASYRLAIPARHGGEPTAAGGATQADAAAALAAAATVVLYGSARGF